MYLPHPLFKDIDFSIDILNNFFFLEKPGFCPKKIQNSQPKIKKPKESMLKFLLISMDRFGLNKPEKSFSFFNNI